MSAVAPGSQTGSDGQGRPPGPGRGAKPRRSQSPRKTDILSKRNSFTGRLSRFLRWVWPWALLAAMGLWMWSDPEILNMVLLVLGFAARIVFAMLYLIVQFGALFWFMSRSKVEVIRPEDPKSITFDDYWGQPTLQRLVKQWISLLSDREQFVKMGGRYINGILLYGPPGTGKCVTGDTRIITPWGYHRIDEIHPARTPDSYWPLGLPVGTVDGIKTASHFYVGGKSKTLRVRTRHGYELEGTLEHPVLCLRPGGRLEWVPLGQLTTDDYVGIARNVEAWGSTAVADAYILGLLVGDGHIASGRRVELSTADPEIAAAFRAWAAANGWPAHKAPAKHDWYVSSAAAVRRVNQMGLPAVLAPDKTVPAALWRADRESARMFLQGLFDADGHAAKDTGYIELALSSHQLVKDVQLLLLKFGVMSRVTRRPVFHRYKGVRKRNVAWKLTLAGRHAALFYERVGFGLARKQSRRENLPATPNPNDDVIPNIGPLLAGWQTRYAREERHPSYDMLERAVAEAGLDHATLAWLLEKRPIWSRVESLEPGEAEVFDITVPDGHAFVANGFISHNTMLAKCMAGEAGIPFISIEGSGFRAMFWGVDVLKMIWFVGKAKKLAREYGASIAYIDEIDAVGMSRGGVMGGQGGMMGGMGGMFGGGSGSLTRLLYEMDGIEEKGRLERLQGRLYRLVGRKPPPRMWHVLFMGSSVTGDTPVYVAGRGVVPIRDVVDPLFREGEEGYRDVWGLQTLGYRHGQVDRRPQRHPKGKQYQAASLQTVQGVYRHTANDLYEVEYLGHRLRMTGNHCVFVVGNKGYLETKLTADLAPGDCLVGLPHVAFAQRNRRANKPIEVDARNIATPIGPLDCELAFILGLWLAEGYIHDGKGIDFCFALDEAEHHEKIAGLAARLGRKLYRKPTQAGGAVNIGFSHAQFARWLTENFGAGSRGKHLPDWAFTLPLDVFEALFAGWVAGDGHAVPYSTSVRTGVPWKKTMAISPGPPAEKVRVTTVSYRLATDFLWACRMHGKKIWMHRHTYKGYGPEGTAYTLKFTTRPTSRFRPIRITAVRKLPGSEMVYDFCGCAGEAFYGGEMPVLLHNTNRPDVLDPALLRPGRFDQKIVVDTPDKAGRREIIKGYLSRVKFDDTVNVEAIVEDTPNATPAQIAAAITKDAVRIALFNNRPKISQHDIDVALQEQRMGIEQPIEEWDPEQRRQVAYHEAGHAVAQHYLMPEQRIVRVSIVRRGGALGYMLPVDRVEVYAAPLRRFAADIMVAMAGHVATKLHMGEYWTGASGDFSMIRRNIWALYSLGYFGPPVRGIENSPSGGGISPSAEPLIERFWKVLEDQTEQLLRKHEAELEAIARALLEKGDLSHDEVMELLGDNGWRPGAPKQLASAPKQLPGPANPLPAPAAEAEAEAPEDAPAWSIEDTQPIRRVSRVTTPPRPIPPAVLRRAAEAGSDSGKRGPSRPTGPRAPVVEAEDDGEQTSRAEAKPKATKRKPAARKKKAGAGKRAPKKSASPRRRTPRKAPARTKKAGSKTRPRKKA